MTNCGHTKSQRKDIPGKGNSRGKGAGEEKSLAGNDNGITVKEEEVGEIAKGQVMQCLVIQGKEFEFSSEGRILSRKDDTVTHDVKGFLWATGWREN